ncbi:MAG: hypothetical protein R3B57_07185 [Phycisphaerales bacterium]
MDFLLGHDGVDWAAGACMVVMLWRLGRHKRDGFLWSAGAALAWVIFNARLEPASAPGIAINAVVLVISVRSWWLWKPEDHPGSSSVASSSSASSSGEKG